MSRKLLTALALFLLVILCIFTVFALQNDAWASSYEYIVDSQKLFDNSTDMITMCKEIRNKLDFNIHVYSVTDEADAESIVEEYQQDASAFLILVSKEKGITWWSGSNVKKTIRDIDFEIIFTSTKATSPNQYTQVVNQILSNIIEIYIRGTKTTDDLNSISNFTAPQKDEGNWLQRNLNAWITYIKQHPVHVLGLLIFAFAVLFYYRYRDIHKEE